MNEQANKEWPNDLDYIVELQTELTKITKELAETHQKAVEVVVQSLKYLTRIIALTNFARYIHTGTWTEEEIRARAKDEQEIE